MLSLQVDVATNTISSMVLLRQWSNLDFDTNHANRARPAHRNSFSTA